MWMSDALRLTASVRIRFTSLTTGRVLGLARQLADVDVVFVLDQLEVFDVEVAHHVGEGRRLVVVLVDRGLDRVFRRDDDLDVVPGEELDVVDREDVRRIGGGEDQRGAGAVHRNHGVLERHLFRDQLDDFAVDLELGEFDRRQSVLLGDEFGEFGFLEVTELGDLMAEASAVGARLVASALQLLRRQHVLTDEQLADPLVHRVPSPASFARADSRRPGAKTAVFWRPWRGPLRIRESPAFPVGYRRPWEGT